MVTGVGQQPGAATASSSKCLVMCPASLMFLRERECPPTWSSEKTLLFPELE